MRALAIAATGMSAQERNIEVIANNVANINTTGFKRSRAEFTDLIYQNERLQGVSSRGARRHGAGRRADRPGRAHRRDPHRQHPGRADQHRQLRSISRSTAAAGSRSPTPAATRVYTRDGAFNTNAQGQLVTADGLPGHARPSSSRRTRPAINGQPDPAS